MCISEEEYLNEAKRKELAEKLNADLDRFIDGLAAGKSQTDVKKPFNFDEWCKEIDQHPAFAQELKPGEDGEYSAEIQAIQALKYDEEDPIECARAHKEEGNRFFQQKKYRWAIDAYTKGIKLNCADSVLNSILYANRAASNCHLGNLRSAIRDCIFARRLDPSNFKATFRAAECLFELKEATKCVDWIETAMSMDWTEQQLKKLDELLGKAMKVKLIEERDKRRDRVKATAEDKQRLKLLLALRKKSVVLKPPIKDLDDIHLLNVSFGQLEKCTSVRLDPFGSGQLIWPLLIQYPQSGQTDFIAECSEDCLLNDLLCEALETPAEWDPNHSFRPNNVRLFVALDRSDCEEQIREVIPEQHSLGQVLAWPNVTVERGLPVIQIYTKEHLLNKLKLISELDSVYRFE